MKKLSLQIEVLGGTDVKIACKDMVLLSRQLDMLITASFNGVSLSATPSKDWTEVWDQYLKELK